MRPFRSLRWRLLVLIELAVVVGMVALTLVLSATVRRTYLTHLEEQLLAEARLIGDALASAMASGPPDGFLDMEARRYAALLDARVTLIGPDGTVWGSPTMTGRRWRITWAGPRSGRLWRRAGDQRSLQPHRRLRDDVRGGCRWRLTAVPWGSRGWPCPSGRFRPTCAASSGRWG